MKKYFKYLLAHPIKLSWIIGLYLFLFCTSFYFFEDISSISNDNPMWIIVIACLLLTGITIAVTFQPFIEWRDGTNNNNK